MKHKLFLPTLILTSILICVSTNADEVALVGAESGKWTMDYDAALKGAAEKNLPVILNFTGSDWCGWCKLMDKKVFAEAAWKDFAKTNAYLVTIDFPSDPLMVPQAYQARNNELKSKYKIEGFPTYLVLDSDGKTVLGRLQAGEQKTPEIFITEFKEATRFSASNVKAYAEANPDKAEEFKKAIAEFRAIDAELTEWLNTSPLKNDENNAKFADFKTRGEAAAKKMNSFK